MSTVLCPPRSTGIAFHVLSDDGDVVRARIEGRLAHRFHAAYDEPLAASVGVDAYSRRVLIDMNDVSALETSGVSWLLWANKRMERSGGKLVLHSLPPAARNVVRVLRLQSVLAIADDEESADALLAGEIQ